MNISTMFWLSYSFLLLSCTTEKEQAYLFFLHNRFLEAHSLEEAHPSYGKVAYTEIITAFEKASFNVISEQRNGNINARVYAQGIVEQIDSLIQKGVAPNKITIVGTSKGGYIAQYVSTLANNSALNFVFIACYTDTDLQTIPEINYCGNILTIYEKSDPAGVSALKRKDASTCSIAHFKEIELNTGLQHGFVFKALDEWIQPSIAWAKGEY